jgi:hypothetical protein
MQQALDIFESYCEIWRLQVNVAKTKVMIFRKRKTAQDPKFILQYTGKTVKKFRLTSIILNTRLNIVIHIINYFETFPFYTSTFY